MIFSTLLTFIRQKNINFVELSKILSNMKKSIGLIIITLLMPMLLLAQSFDQLRKGFADC